MKVGNPVLILGSITGGPDPDGDYRVKTPNGPELWYRRESLTAYDSAVFAACIQAVGFLLSAERLPTNNDSIAIRAVGLYHACMAKMQKDSQDG